MKKFIIIITLLIILFSCITEQGESVTYVYTVKNESGKAIIVKSFKSDNPTQIPVITYLNINQVLTKKYNIGLPPKDYNFANFFGEDNQPRDSIIIIYNNDKIQSFSLGCKDNNTRNPLNFCEYSKEVETFIFTTQDYINAENCNGNCE